MCDAFVVYVLLNVFSAAKTDVWYYYSSCDTLLYSDSSKIISIRFNSTHVRKSIRFDTSVYVLLHYSSVPTVEFGKLWIQAQVFNKLWSNRTVLFCLGVSDLRNRFESRIGMQCLYLLLLVTE